MNIFLRINKLIKIKRDSIFNDHVKPFLFSKLIFVFFSTTTNETFSTFLVIQRISFFISSITTCWWSMFDKAYLTKRKQTTRSNSTKSQNPKDRDKRLLWKLTLGSGGREWNSEPLEWCLLRWLTQHQVDHQLIENRPNRLNILQQLIRRLTSLTRNNRRESYT